MTCMRAGRSSKFGQIQLLTVELAALEHLKKSPLTYNGKNIVASFYAPNFEKVGSILVSAFASVCFIISQKILQLGASNLVS